MVKILKKLPDSEILQSSLYNRAGEVMFYITKKQSADVFQIYKVLSEGLEFLGKGSSPIELEARFNTKTAIYG